eukprot:365618-Chlamydomonas_euryale.AAC.5
MVLAPCQPLAMGAGPQEYTPAVVGASSMLEARRQSDCANCSAITARSGHDPGPQCAVQHAVRALRQATVMEDGHLG